MDKFRLITAQGPLQLITAISVLRAKQEAQLNENYQDILILGDYCGVELDEVCLQIAKSWNFSSILSFKHFEFLYNTGQADFLTLTKILREGVNIPEIDSLYVCRNWQLINEAFLSAYPEANKYCYGDGAGFIDLKRNGDENPSQSLSPNGYVDIDHSYLMVAHHWKQPMMNFNHTLVDPKFLKLSVLAAADKIDNLKEYCEHISKVTNGNLSIALTSNHTESGCFNNQFDEINCYFDCLQENSDRNNTFLIKGHPREMYEQSLGLAQALAKHGRNVLVVSDPFIKVPIELFLAYLQPKNVFSLFSGSCITLAYLFDVDLQIGLGEKLLKQYYNGNKLTQALYEEQIFAIFARQAYDKSFYSIESLEIHKKMESPNNRHQYPISLTRRRAASHLESRL